ncbi:MAG TPA: tail fiber protein [Blastocatellia bacterium]|nr:tail fiber protein [Blastocatellia bacterium]
MGTPFLGEIKIVSFNFAPKGWALCNGQLLPINQNQALFSLFGTTYGGDGRVNFALPDFRGRAPLHFGDGFTQGERGGEENHTLIISEMTGHTHQVSAATNAPNAGTPVGNMLCESPPANSLFAATPNTAMAPQAVGNVGGSQPHNNLQPYLCLNFIVALQGIFPSQT